LLVRRHRDTGELAFYRCYSPEPVPLRELVRVAGRRWTVEESFQAGKGLAGLDEHQVRRWTSWRRWTLFAMLALALLAVIAAHEHTARPAPAGLIALTCNEIRRLLTVLVVEPDRVLACPRAWSTWRRRHQHRARTTTNSDSTSCPITGSKRSSASSRSPPKARAYTAVDVLLSPTQQSQ
jgi:hypothetical protein